MSTRISRSVGRRACKVTVEKIIAFIEPCNAGFGHVFNDSIWTCHVMYSQCCQRQDHRLPSLPNSELVFFLFFFRTSFNASLFPASQIQSLPGSVNCVSNFIVFSCGTDAPMSWVQSKDRDKSLQALPTPLTGP